MPQIAAKIPFGVGEGEIMTVQTKDGRKYELTVPQGSKPGQQLLVTVPEYNQSFQAATGEEMQRQPLSDECVMPLPQSTAMVSARTLPHPDEIATTTNHRVATTAPAAAAAAAAT